MINDIIVYVLMDSNGAIIRYSNIPGTGSEVVQDDPVIDMSKLQGYNIVSGEDGRRHLVFDQVKYDNYIQTETEKVAKEQVNDELEALAKKQLLPSLPDEIAYSFRMLYPEFEIGVDYEVGDRMMYNGVFYKVVQAHTSQENWTPDVAVSVFVVIPDPNVEYPMFVQPISKETSYMTGDKVTFLGNKYICTQDYTVHSPEAYPTAWNRVEEA